MWETQKMLAQDHEVELVRQAERLNRRVRGVGATSTWRLVLAGAAQVLFWRKSQAVSQQLPATND